MITRERASFLAHEWIEGWNRRDPEKMLRHYARSVQYISPQIFSSDEEETFTIKGRGNLRQYFLQGMTRYRNIYFRIQEIMVGVDSLSIVYKTSHDKMGLEIMFLNKQGMVWRSYAYYQN